MIQPPERRHDLADPQQLVRRLPKPMADPEFRSTLRAAFVRGAIPERRLPPLLRFLGAPRSRWFAGAFAAAAAVIATMWLNPGPAWQIREVTGSGSMQLDGRTVALSSNAEISHLLHAGVRIELPAQTQLDLELPGIALFQVVGGSRVVLPASPGRWYARAVRGSIEAGELRITTGPRFHGTHLVIETPEAQAEVTGTTLAVFRLPDASCVCVLEGAVVMSDPNAAPDTVHAGFRRVVYRDGRAPLVEPILPMERMKLEMLHAQSAAAQAR